MIWQLRDIQYLKSFMGEKAERLKDLNDYEFLFYNS